MKKNSSGKQFFFTIDCDWIPGSEKGLKGLFEISKKFNLKPTLFVAGQFALSYPNIIKEALDYGYEIGAHGWEHGLGAEENYRSTNYEQQKKWIILSVQAIEKVTGKKPFSFRAPYLWISETLLLVLEEMGFLFDSSVPARRFDFGVGHINQFRYFFSPLEPYHPSSAHFGRRGNSSILEVPPSAYVVPLNMSALRILGLGALKQVVRLVEKRSPILVFYSHPLEFISQNQLPSVDKEPFLFRKNIGPDNFALLEKLLSFIINRGYTPSFISEAKK